MLKKIITIAVLCLIGVVIGIVAYNVLIKDKDKTEPKSSKAKPTKEVTEAPTETPTEAPKEQGEPGVAHIKDKNGVEHTLHYDAAKFPKVDEWGGAAIQMFYGVDENSYVTLTLFEYENFDHFAEKTVNKYNDGRQVFDLDGHRCVEYTQLNSYDKKYCVEIYDNGGLDWLVIGIEFTFRSENVDMSEAEDIVRNMVANFEP